MFPIICAVYRRSEQAEIPALSVDHGWESRSSDTEEDV